MQNFLNIVPNVDKNVLFDMKSSIPQINRMGLSVALNLHLCGKAASRDLEGLFVSEHWERCVPGL